MMSLGPGCHSMGSLGYDSYAWGNQTFAPNPVAEIPFFTGMVLGIIAGLPLCILSAPMALIGYPSEDGDEFFISSALFPSVTLGSLVGTVLAAPFYPFGIPLLPDDPVVVKGEPR